MSVRRVSGRVGLVLAAMVLAEVGAGAQTGRSRAANDMAETTGALGPNAGGGVGERAVRTGGKLRILFADVEGGQATLFVTPRGHSLLIDTGWPANGGRDADRVVALAHRAGLKRIDDVLLTHYHTDHAGGVPNLVERISVGHFLDHGVNRETTGEPETVAAYTAYERVVAERRIPRTTVQLGQRLPMASLERDGIESTVVSSDGEVLAKPLEGAGEANLACERSQEKAAENSENDRSVGVVLRFGRARVVDLGDLTWAKERLLVCPVDKLGPADLLVVSHHGTDRSNSPALIAALRPRVAVVDNGATKGGEPGTMRTLADPANGVGAVWQLHAAERIAPDLNTVQDRMANRAGEDGSWLEVDVSRDGMIEVTNGRTGEVVRYGATSSRHRS